MSNKLRNDEPQKKIFVSYRRDDDGAYLVPELNRKLTSRYGADSVFYDIDNIPLGVDFRDYLSNAISSASIVLVVIGDRWAGYDAQTGHRRIDRDDDFVRIEVEAALNRSIPVVPVLVGKATMPCETELPGSIGKLAFRNAAEVRTGKDYELHMAELLRGLDAIMTAPKHERPTAVQSKIESELPNENPVAEATLSKADKLRFDYWTQLLALANQKTSLHARTKPNCRAYVQRSMSKGFVLRYACNAQRSEVGLYIDFNSDADRKQKNTEAFLGLLQNKDSIEEKFCGHLDWINEPESLACLICTYIDGGTQSPRESWPRIHASMVDAMMRLFKALPSDIVGSEK